MPVSKLLIFNEYNQQMYMERFSGEQGIDKEKSH